jgi:alpha-beta hydrolase superfamily lysophospholipase
MNRQALPPPTPVSFQNRDGLRLFGLLHQPAVPREGAETVLILSPGVKMRVAPHRLYVKLAERFVSMGHPVLRFDFHGLGDSEGAAPEALLADFYGATQHGRYVSDTTAAMDWMQRTHGARRFIAAGLCGGALTGLLTAANDPRIVALCAISIPVILDGSNRDAGRYMTAGQLTATRTDYLRKLRVSEWRSWVRLLTFRSDFRMIARSLFKPIQARLRRLKPTISTTSTPETVAAAGPSDNTNPLFAPAFHRMVTTSRPVLLVFAESDRLYWEFEEKFLRRHGASLEPHAALYRVHVTPQANHIFSSSEWQEDLFEQCCRWLEQRAAPMGQRGAALAQEVGVREKLTIGERA